MLLIGIMRNESSLGFFKIFGINRRINSHMLHKVLFDNY